MLGRSRRFPGVSLPVVRLNGIEEERLGGGAKWKPRSPSNGRKQDGAQDEKLMRSENRKKMDGSPSRDSDYRTRTNGYRLFKETYREVDRVVR